MFPTLKKIHPNRFLALSFSTIQAPVVLFMPQHAGGIGFTLFGKIILSILDENKQNETEVAEMGIDVNAKMQMRLTSTVVKPRLSFNSIKLVRLRMFEILNLISEAKMGPWVKVIWVPDPRDPNGSQNFNSKQQKVISISFCSLISSTASQIT
jgi:hypothetical protein